MQIARVLTVLIAFAQVASAQEMRRRESSSAPTTQPADGIPRDAHFPYAGIWSGRRVMPIGTDDIGLSFTIAGGKYVGLLLHPDGGRAPSEHLTASAAGLTWESPNSGGGTWVFHVHLAGPDSLVGTLVLRDAPAGLTPAPSGTMVMTRRAPKK